MFLFGKLGGRCFRIEASSLSKSILELEGDLVGPGLSLDAPFCEGNPEAGDEASFKIRGTQNYKIVLRLYFFR